MVIASHYAEPMRRFLSKSTNLLARPAGEVIGSLEEGEAIDVLDCSIGWAWGYAGAQRRVGYVDATLLRE